MFSSVKSPLTFYRSLTQISFSFSACRRRKKDDKQKDETETRPQSPIEKPWKMMDDVSLQLLVKEAKEFILPLSDEREQYAALAR